MVHSLSKKFKETIPVPVLLPVRRLKMKQNNFKVGTYDTLEEQLSPEINLISEVNVGDYIPTPASYRNI